MRALVTLVIVSTRMTFTVIKRKSELYFFKNYLYSLEHSLFSLFKRYVRLFLFLGGHQPSRCNRCNRYILSLDNRHPPYVL